jgi:cytochrome c oxidase subunit IV
MKGFRLPVYFLVFAALIALTLTTVGLSTLSLGVWHTPVGLLIAATKAALVALVFMHILKSNKLTWIVALSGTFWLFILMALSLSDFLTRLWLSRQGD